MLTNVIAYLHTTLAYQSAAMQLMAGQANLAAQQLHLNEPVPIVVPANTNDWRLAMPPDGVTGILTTSNNIYRFSAGKLLSVQRKVQRHGTAEATAPSASLIDTNGAYQLARQYLAAISVDVPALENQYPHTITQLGARPPVRRRSNATNTVPAHADAPAAAPTFRISWGGAENSAHAAPGNKTQVIMDILGSTKQCTGLRIENPDWLKTPPLRVTNAAALLGTPPPPQHFVEQFLGGRAAYETVAKPDRVVASLLKAQGDDPNNKTESVPVMANPGTAALLSQTLTDFNSYDWLTDKCGLPDYGVRLRFAKGADTVEILWAADCDHLQATFNGVAAEKRLRSRPREIGSGIQSHFSDRHRDQEF